MLLIDFIQMMFFYTDTDSLNNENKQWEIKLFWLVKIYYKVRIIIKIVEFGLVQFWQQKKYCLAIINKDGVIDEHKTFKSLTDVSQNLDTKEYFKMFNGDKLIAKVPLSQKKSFSMQFVNHIK